MERLAIDITLPRRSFDLRVKLDLDAETVALVGPSGSGKTSLLRAIAGLEPSTSGRIGLGEEWWLDSERRVRLAPERRRVGYLPQDYGLFPHMTVEANVRFAAGRARPDLLERLKIGHLASARPDRLSGGERQRAALARALARDPGLLLLDEPFASLDTITRAHVRDELGEILTDLRLPALLVTHAFEDAAMLASRAGVLDAGQLAQLAPPAELERTPASVLVAALTGANILHGTARPGDPGARVLLDGGGELRCMKSASGPVALAIQPWAIELTDPAAGSLTDRVVSVREDRGTVMVRLTRLTAHIHPSADGHPYLAENALVGVRAAPEDIHLLPQARRPDFT